MSDEISAKSIHSVLWGCDDGRDVVCFAAGTEAEAQRCLELLRELRDVGGDDRFRYRVEELKDEEYAEGIVGLEDWEADPEQLDGLIERLQLDIVEAAEDAKCTIEDEIGDLENEIEDLMERVASKRAEIAAIDLRLSLIICAEV